MSTYKSAKKLIIRMFVLSILALNGIAYGSAYLMTNYKTNNKLSFGIARPQNYNNPGEFDLEYTTHKVEVKNKEFLHSWFIAKKQNSQGVVVLFHGKDNSKSSLVDAAKIFNQLGYDTLLVDFRGSGGSSGNNTTIGFREAEDVLAAVNYLDRLATDKPIILYGISMGTAAILRAVAEKNIKVDSIILELPFTSLLDAVKTRFNNSNLPPSPMAELLVFWGGMQHGFNGFEHQPIEYAKSVDCPTLILAGDRDRTITIAEVNKIYNNLAVPKDMIVFPEAGHEILARDYPELWQKSVADFLTFKGQNKDNL